MKISVIGAGYVGLTTASLSGGNRPHGFLR